MMNIDEKKLRESRQTLVEEIVKIQKQANEAQVFLNNATQRISHMQGQIAMIDVLTKKQFDAPAL